MDMDREENIMSTQDESQSSPYSSDDSEDTGNMAVIGKRNLGRKRKRNPGNHKRNMKKRTVERGAARQTKSGKFIPAKKFTPQHSCKCKPLMCWQKIDLAHLEHLFTTFYTHCNTTQQTLLLRSSVTTKVVKEKTTNFLPIIPIKNRTFNCEFSVPDADGIRQSVCRSFFLGVYQVTPSRVYRAIKTATANPAAVEKRGKQPSVNQVTEAEKNRVRQFFNSFPRYESHYSRSSSQRQYLNPNLNLTKLFSLYKELCEIQHRKPVSQHMFRHIFNFDFNLSFKRRHSDTCKTCDYLALSLSNVKVSEEERTKLEKQQRDHHEQSEALHEEWKRDVAFADEKTAVFTFDLQKALETPSLTVNVAYYKRQLWTYNLCIFDEKKKKAYMYMWSEDVASRGSQEMASCLIALFKEHLPATVNHIILYSDSCGGQNRNIKLTLMLKHFLVSSSTVELIHQKYFLSGHSYNSCDRSFSLIEKERKLHEIIATPSEWVKIIANTKKSRPKFVSKVMEADDFVSSLSLERLIVNRKVDVKKVKINWLQIRSIIYDKNQLFSIIISDFNNERHCIDIKKRQVSEEDFVTNEMVHLYPFGRKITKAKYDDLMQLKQFIPFAHRAFYDNLKYDGSNSDDYALASGQRDDE